ncbi:hypothetical protein [Aquabacterium sp. OR-4]|uniref:hypothetical protein n=1 Tax=Aquabacterium sp. OR-4 TaxID=2978127 RepID=UPI0021B4BAF1|nr:hypothetical protein [Aquabacterium sp. OR-4]MDT7837755.1 hypothetical protein [Aquabacterium sp. OR-4]
MAEAGNRPPGGLLGGLLSRFDDELLRAPVLATGANGNAAGPPTLAAVQAWIGQPLAAALLEWCHAPQPALAVAELSGRGAPALAEALALQIDGSLRLQACAGTGARLALRLGVKCDDLLRALGRAPRRSDCWDSGWLRDGPAALARLPHWQARRPTLLLAGDRPADARAALLAALSAAASARSTDACSAGAPVASSATSPAASAAARPITGPAARRPVLRLLWVHDSGTPLTWRPLA